MYIAYQARPDSQYIISKDVVILDIPGHLVTEWNEHILKLRYAGINLSSREDYLTWNGGLQNVQIKEDEAYSIIK